MNKVVITGGSGTIGRVLARRLTEQGFEVTILSRRANAKEESSFSFWDVENKIIDKELINSANILIHLAGVNISQKRWTEKRKKEIIDSRVNSLSLIQSSLNKDKMKLHTLISSSAIGYYGAVSSERVYMETDPAASDFLGKTCLEWENAALKFAGLGVRTVILRTGIVLSNKGGALSKFKLSARFGLVPAIGNAKQHFPWIHMDDLCSIYLFAVNNSHVQGTYNAVAPQPVTYKEFARVMANSIKWMTITLPVPAFLLRMFFGSMSVMLLEGSRVSAEKIMGSGFSFKYPQIELALKDLLGK